MFLPAFSHGLNLRWMAVGLQKPKDECSLLEPSCFLKAWRLDLQQYISCAEYFRFKVGTFFEVGTVGEASCRASSLLYRDVHPGLGKTGNKFRYQRNPAALPGLSLLEC